MPKCTGTYGEVFTTFFLPIQSVLLKQQLTHHEDSQLAQIDLEKRAAFLGRVHGDE